MEQGKIDQLLSTKPEERRVVFEEAAGHHAVSRPRPGSREEAREDGREHAPRRGNPRRGAPELHLPQGAGGEGRSLPEAARADLRGGAGDPAPAAERAPGGQEEAGRRAWRRKRRPETRSQQAIDARERRPLPSRWTWSTPWSPSWWNRTRSSTSSTWKRTRARTRSTSSASGSRSSSAHRGRPGAGEEHFATSWRSWPRRARGGRRASRSWPGGSRRQRATSKGSPATSTASAPGCAQTMKRSASNGTAITELEADHGGAADGAARHHGRHRHAA